MGGASPKGGSSAGSSSPNQSVVTQVSQPSPQILSDYQNAINRATTVANQPLQQYGGPTVAGFTPMQQTAFNTVDQSQGMANPYINAATQYVGSGATPIAPTPFSQNAVQQYISPFTQNVVDATQAQFNNQNQQQQQQLVGNAISKGAWGGDRAGIASAELANQQHLAQAPVIAGLYNTSYNQALGEFNAQQQAGIGAQEASGWLGENAGFALGNLGQEAQSTALTGASSELQSGALQQQLAQEQLNIPYEQFVQQQAYPFQTAGWLAGLTEGIGGQSGGVAATATPGPSSTAQLAGLGLSGLGILGQAGAFNSPTTARRGGRIGYDRGGITPFDPYSYDFSYMPASRDMPNMAISIVGDPPQQSGAYPRGSTPAAPNFASSANSAGSSNSSGSGGGGMGGLGNLTKLFGGNNGASSASSAFPLGTTSATLDGGSGYFNLLGGSMGAAAGVDAGGMSLADMAGAGMLAMRRGGRTRPHFAGGGFLTDYLNSGIQRDANGNPLPREQHSRALGEATGAIGSLFGPVGGMGGTAIGDAFGNMFAGKNAYTGRGDFWSNLNPVDPNGPLFGAIGPYSPMGAMGGTGMTSNMFGGTGGMLNGMMGGASGNGSPMSMLGLRRGGRAAYAAGGAGPSSGPMFDDSIMSSRGIALPQLKTSGIGKGPNVDTNAPAITTPPPGIFTNPSYALPSSEITPMSGPLGVSVPQTNDNTALPLLGGVLGIGALGLANRNGLFNNSNNVTNGVLPGQQPTTVPLTGAVDPAGFDGSTITPSAHGGRVGRDIGGGVMSAGAGMAGMPPNMGNPIAGNMLSQYSQLPPEKLQELAVRMPPNSPQGQMIQRALMMARMNPGRQPQQQPQSAAPQPAVAPQAPQAPQPAVAPTVQPQQPPMAAGGRARYDDGGDVADYAAGYQRTPGYKGEEPDHRSFGAMFKPVVDWLQSPVEGVPTARSRFDQNPHHQTPSLPRPAAMTMPGEAGINEPGPEMAGPMMPPRDAISARTGSWGPTGAGTAMADEPDVRPQGMSYPPPPPPKPKTPQGAAVAGDDDDDAAPPAAGGAGSSAPSSSARPAPQSPATALPPVQQTQPFKSAYPARSPWELAIAAGAGMMSSRSPFAGVAMGEGLNEGLKYMQKGREDEVGQYKAENEAKRFSEEVANTRARLGLESKHNSDLETHYQDERHHWDQLEKQGKYQLIPGPGRDPNTGETVMGAYKFNGKNGQNEFLPGVVPTARQGNPASNRAHLVEVEIQRAQHDEDAKSRENPNYKRRSDADIRTGAEKYVDGMTGGYGAPAAGHQQQQPQAAPQVDWSKVQRPSGVPGGAQYSPSTKTWWWQDNGQWKSAPGG